MTAELSPIELAKFAAAKRASLMVENGMRVGLGTGSTATWLVKCLGERVRDEGLRFSGVATSTRTAALAMDVGIRTIALDEARWLDLTIDGADEFDGTMTLVKGGGGALLREKIVACASDKMVVIADAGKQVNMLGAFPLPVEVIPFGLRTTKTLIERLLAELGTPGRTTTLRMDGDKPFLTDAGNHIIDLHLGRIDAPAVLGDALNQIPGVVENGLFVGICDKIVVGHGDGRVELRDLASPRVEDAVVEILREDNLFGTICD
jgi:ribose 5-phosphate isomerase A